MATYRCKQGDMLDEVVWRHYGRQAGAVEAVLEANPDLSAHEPRLVIGTVIELPDLAEPEPVRETTRLWS